MPQDVSVLSTVALAKAVCQRVRSLVPRPAILMYHRVADESFDPWGLAVSPRNFASQLNWLAKRRTVLPLTEFAERHRRGDLPSDAVAITFDDGYACTASQAAPVLRELALPATIFIAAGLVQRRREFWWDELERIVMEHGGDVLRMDGREFDLGRSQADDRVWRPGEPPRTARQQAFHGLWSLLRERRPRELEAAMQDLREQGATGQDRPQLLPMTRAEIRSLLGSGHVDFGSHTSTHAYLPALSRAEKVQEIEGSIARCSEITGANPRTFAYPYGQLDPEAREIVAEFGFGCACTTEHLLVRRHMDPFALPRLSAANTDARGLSQMLSRA